MWKKVPNFPQSVEALLAELTLWKNKRLTMRKDEFDNSEKLQHTKESKGNMLRPLTVDSSCLEYFSWEKYFKECFIASKGPNFTVRS